MSNADAFGPVERASSSGVVVAEDGANILVYDRGIGGLAIMLFVVGLVGVLLLMPASLFTYQAVTIEDGPSLALAAGLWLAPLLAAGMSLVVWRALSRRRAQPLTDLTPIVIFDRAAGVMRTASGQPIAPLAQVRIDRRFSATSSSPTLVARYGGQVLPIARPNPFAGGLGNLDKHLAAAIGQPRS